MSHTGRWNFVQMLVKPMPTICSSMAFPTMTVNLEDDSQLPTRPPSQDGPMAEESSA